MTYSAHELPQPHEPVEGILDDEAQEVENDDELQPDFEVEETNPKDDYAGLHVAPTFVEPLVEDTPPVESPLEVAPENQNESNNDTEQEES